MTAKATMKASKLVEAARQEKGEKLTKTELVRVAGLTYVPPILMGVATITCIFGANLLNKRQQASLISAYAVLDQRYKNYKSKVTDIYGEDANDNIADSMAKEDYQGKTDEEKELFYDLYSQRYFESTLEEVKQAKHDINRIMVTECGAGLNEFYDLIGLEPKDEYKDLGWSSPMMEEMYWHPWIEIEHRKVVMDDGLECYILELVLEPFLEYLEW